MSKIVSKTLLFLSMILSIGIIVYFILIWIKGWDYPAYLTIIIIAIVVLQGLEFFISYKTNKK